MNIFIKTGLRMKILIPVIIIMLVTILVMIIITTIDLTAAYNEAIGYAEQGFDDIIRTSVENMVSILQVNHQRYLNGLLTEAEAYETAKSLVRDARYNSAPDKNGDGYFWADMADGLCVAHYSELNDGVNRWDTQDRSPEKIYYVRNIVEIGNKGGGYTEFYTGKVGDETGAYKKRSYTLKFEPYGWYVSTGNYYENIDDTIGKVQTQQRNALIILIGISLAISAAGVIILIIIIKSIVNPLIKAKDSLYTVGDNIEKSVAQLTDAAAAIAGSSSQQAASIEETSATMNETSSMISQNAENTRQAAQFARQSKESADSGMVKMRDMVDSMNRLKESSGMISRIIKTIDDIAFQTNLLAINATIEAARAGGDAGRSFSVVAQEVRTLAQKSATAAAETVEIVEKNISLTKSGGRISGEVSEALGAITNQFANLNKIINEISTASEEQSNGVMQINGAMSQIEQSTQANAAVSEESAATAKMLQELIHDLEEVYNSIELVVEGKK